MDSAWGLTITGASSGSGMGLVVCNNFFFLADLGGLGAPNLSGRLTPIIVLCFGCSGWSVSKTDAVSTPHLTLIPLKQ